MSNPPQAQFDAWTWSGPNVGTCLRELRPGEKALVLFLDPVSVVVAMPPFPGGELALTRFCRILAHTARQLAAVSCLDMARPSPQADRHNGNRAIEEK